MVITFRLLGVLNCQLKYLDTNLCSLVRSVYYSLITYIFHVRLALNVKVGEDGGMAGVEPKNRANLCRYWTFTPLPHLH